MAQLLSRFSSDVILYGTLVLGASILLLGFRLYFGKGDEIRRNLGASLLSGSVITLAVFLLQAMLTTISSQEEQQRLEEQRFFDLLQTTDDLRGFNPGNYSLASLYLNGKDLSEAFLRGARMQGTQLRNATLELADLRNADARNANFSEVDFFQAELPGADLRGADLRSAKFEDAQVWTADFRGARVNSETCWPPSFWRVKAFKAGLVPTRSTGSLPTLGHPCAPGEHKEVDRGVRR